MDEKKVIRILHYGLDSSYGGTESYVLNIYRALDKKKVQFDFLLKKGKNIPFEAEIKEMGGRIFREVVGMKKNPISTHKSLDHFFKTNKDIDGLEMHSNSMVNFLPLYYARKYGIEMRIYHAHNSGNMSNNDNFLLSQWKKYTLENVYKNSTHLVACSKDAGEYMFKDANFDILNNSIDVKKFSYNSAKRTSVRKALDLENNLVVGFVGRLQYQKNPEYLIDIYNEIFKREPKAKLLIVGTGSLEEKIKKKVQDYNLENNVIFLGSRNDVDSLYQAMDLFLLPSRFEGFGIVLAEAQCSGLLCFTSNKVPFSTKITDNIYYKDINDKANTWADDILKIAKNHTRVDCSKQLQEKGFDLSSQVKLLEHFYTNRKLG